MGEHTGNKIELAMDMLLRGYQEELNLYSAMHELTLTQKEILGDEGSLSRFCDLLQEKEQILRVIGQIDDEMSGAKALITSSAPNGTPRRRQLNALLDRLTDTIDDLRALEQDNASVLLPNMAG